MKFSAAFFRFFLFFLILGTGFWTSAFSQGFYGESVGSPSRIEPTEKVEKPATESAEIENDAKTGITFDGYVKGLFVPVYTKNIPGGVAVGGSAITTPGYKGAAALGAGFKGLPEMLLNLHGTNREMGFDLSLFAGTDFSEDNTDFDYDLKGWLWWQPISQLKITLGTGENHASDSIYRMESFYDFTSGYLSDLTPLQIRLGHDSEGIFSPIYLTRPSLMFEVFPIKQVHLALAISPNVKDNLGVNIYARMLEGLYVSAALNMAGVGNFRVAYIGSGNSAVIADPEDVTDTMSPNFVNGRFETAFAFRLLEDFYFDVAFKFMSKKDHVDKNGAPVDYSSAYMALASSWNGFAPFHFYFIIDSTLTPEKKSGATQTSFYLNPTLEFQTVDFGLGLAVGYRSGDKTSNKKNGVAFGASLYADVKRKMGNVKIGIVVTPPMRSDIEDGKKFGLAVPFSITYNF
ncbi:MAG: hypothetical protein Ta2A_23290 [Treponemataceae bacterium]|nr:MAG: hypothetical protein Ta2A_23290 [Treponemataceae bacterium]